MTTVAERVQYTIARLALRMHRSLLPYGNEEERTQAVEYLGRFAREVLGPAADEHAGDDLPPTDPLSRLAGALALEDLEQDLMLLAALPEEHWALAEALRAFHPRGEAFATPGLAAMCLASGPDERHQLDRLLATGPAITSGLLRLATGSDPAPFPERNLRLADEVWRAIKGLDVWPAFLEPTRTAVAMCGLASWLESPPCREAILALRSARPLTILVLAADEETAFHRGRALAEHAAVPLLSISWPGAGAPASAESLLSLHSLARGAIPVVQLPTAGDPPPTIPTLARHPGPVVLCASTTVPLGEARVAVSVEVHRLGARDHRQMWRDTVPELAGHATSLATQLPVEPFIAATAAQDARAAAALASRPVTTADVHAGVRRRVAVAAAAGCKLVHPRLGWDRLVLKQEHIDQLREAIERLAHQAEVLEDWRFLAGHTGARGVRMLFSGPPGTGKTLSAEVMAKEIGVDLLVVDIAKVVSKWIGETEKNLARVFEAAERSAAVLFFDEADALFGKRSQVSDAHDRYANIEIAYLLSRVEQFDGLAILSTNLRQHLDRAFLRRFEFILDFEEPTPEQRKRLWRMHIPEGAPVAGDLDLGELGDSYTIVGAYIRNAAVAAAFLAASEGAPISRRHVVHALRREFDKNGRPFPRESA